MNSSSYLSFDRDEDRKLDMWSIDEVLISELDRQKPSRKAQLTPPEDIPANSSTPEAWPNSF